MSFNDLDVGITLWLNGLFAPHPVASSLYDRMANNNLFRGLPIFMSISWLWFRNEQPDTRLQISLGLIGACLATIVSVGLQKAGLPHVRPFLDPALGLAVPSQIDLVGWANAWPSWPSDTATLFSALTMIIIVQNRALGALIGVWLTVVILLPRVIFGYHYTSDVLSGVILGGLAVLALGACSRLTISRPVEPLFQRWAAASNVIFTLVIWQMAGLMFDARDILSAVRTFIQA